MSNRTPRRLITDADTDRWVETGRLRATGPFPPASQSEIDSIPVAEAPEQGTPTQVVAAAS